MAMTAHAQESRTVFRRIGAWLKNWRERPTALTELEACGDREVERIANDAGMSVGDLRVLAGKWPDAAHLAERRMAALGLDAARMRETEPAVMRDVQRVCSLCASKRVCVHDLDRDPANAAWHEYCPNEETLDALRSRSSASGRNVK